MNKDQFAKCFWPAARKARSFVQNIDHCIEKADLPDVGASAAAIFEVAGWDDDTRRFLETAVEYLIKAGRKSAMLDDLNKAREDLEKQIEEHTGEKAEIPAPDYFEGVISNPCMEEKDAS